MVISVALRLTGPGLSSTNSEAPTADDAEVGRIHQLAICFAVDRNAVGPVFEAGDQVEVLREG